MLSAREINTSDLFIGDLWFLPTNKTIESISILKEAHTGNLHTASQGYLSNVQVLDVMQLCKCRLKFPRSWNASDHTLLPPPMMLLNTAHWFLPNKILQWKGIILSVILYIWAVIFKTNTSFMSNLIFDIINVLKGQKVQLLLLQQKRTCQELYT